MYLKPLKTKTKIVTFVLFLALASGVHAASFTPIPELVEAKVSKWETCKLNIFCYFRPLLGASFTTINTTDRIRDLPTTLNANFALINTGFIEMGTTSVDSITTLSNLATAGSLVTVGTITSGTWNAGTIATAYGGTGSASWPSTNSVLYASSTNTVLSVPVGTEDQILTLVNIGGSAGLVPQWQSGAIDQTLQYNWSGLQFWTATATFSGVASFFDSLFFEGTGTSTLDFSGTNANTASSTFLATDANGAVSWVPYSYLLKNTNTNTTSSTATTTQITVDIPANTLRGAGIVKIVADVSIDIGVVGVSQGITLNLLFGSGNTLLASTTIPNATAGLSDGVYYGTLEIFLNESGANSQEGWFHGVFRGTGVISGTLQHMFAASSQEVKASSENTSSTQTLRLDTIEATSDELFTVRNYSVEIIR